MRATGLTLVYCGFLLFAAACKTTGNPPTNLKVGEDAALEDIPSLTVENLTPSMINRIVSEARKDAVAMFGGKALFQTIIFDNSIDSGPCAGFLGARVLFANADRNPEPQRKFAMYTLNPVPAGPDRCANSITAGPKWEDDVKNHLSGTRNMETALGGASAIKISLADAVRKLRADNPRFETPLVVSIMNPAEEMMKAHAWAVIYGRSCGEEGVAYVNMSTGKVVAAANPMKKDCQ